MRSKDAVQFKKYFFIVFAILIGGVSLLLMHRALAQAQPPDLGLAPVAQTGLATTDIRIIIARIIRTVLGLLGIVALIIVLYGGFMWMTAGGSEEKVGTAKKLLLNGGVGLVIILSSYAITSFVLNRLLAATQGTEVGGGGAGGGGGGGGGLTPGDVLVINSLPASGTACIRNIHPVVIFNRDVAVNSLADNIVLKRKDTGVTVAGVWSYGDKQSIAIFTPNGSCSPDQGSDCLDPNAQYELSVPNPNAVQSADGRLNLNCAIRSCGPVAFTSGAGVDRVPPTITITSPTENTLLAAGASVPIHLSFTDDNGVQAISVFNGTNLVGSQSFSGCQKTGTADVTWVTSGLAPGNYTIQGIALDYSALKGTASQNVSLRPGHCFDTVLDPGEAQVGPPACGGECGACGGTSCNNNSQCASGFCSIPNGQTQGVCVDKMSIQNVSPLSGATSTYITISGNYFGTTPGSAYFARVANPDVQKPGDWVEARVVNCGAGFNNWTASQILVEVPSGIAADGPLKITTASTTGSDGIVRKFTDATNDTWGPRINNFQLTNQVRPGLCALVPSSGYPGDTIQLRGKNLGLLDNANDQVSFGGIKAAVDPNDWSDTVIQAVVPAQNPGMVGVVATNNSVVSNGLGFIIKAGTASDVPVISSVSPNHGPVGEYVTITGKNFGVNSGKVWFKLNGQGAAYTGDTNFPIDCKQTIWSDTQVIVKVPAGVAIGNYSVQVNTASGKSNLPAGSFFTVENGQPTPGICKMTPVSGPVPFAAGVTMQISGEYFGVNPDVYFWKSGASSTAVAGRIAADKNDSYSAGANTITVRPPAGTQSGPVVVYRTNDQQMSNNLPFSVFDCTKTTPPNTCSQQNYQCCSSGGQAGMCQPPGTLCQGATRSTGYLWRFSTKDIPLVPHVVERCDSQTDQGKNLPSPAPSTQWDQTASGDQHNVCRGALVTVEFNTLLSQATVNGQNVRVNRCTTVATGTTCVNPVPVTLTADSYSLKVAQGNAQGVGNYLELHNSQKWDATTWYQVILSKNIRSVGTTTSSAALAVDNSCGGDSAYCFVFKTGTSECSFKQVVITPYTYWTSRLEAPIRVHGSGGDSGDLYYYGSGLSNQHCIMMDTSGFDWTWKSADATYAAIFRGLDTGPRVQVSALANTVGVGIANPVNAVNIDATAATTTANGSVSYTGHSPLTIDLSSPEVIDYWPQCLEACTNANVGVRFNVTMSNRNLDSAAEKGSVQLLKCLDENCLSTEAVGDSKQIYLDQNSQYTVLNIANSQFGVSLEPSTLYQVILSASTTNVNAPNLLWSASGFSDPSSASKPYNKIFTWRFRTKKDSCTVSRVEVDPPLFKAVFYDDRSVYAATPYSSPDSCSRDGQKLDPWSVSWSWGSSNSQVAAVTTFSTEPTNAFCTPTCVRKGSSIPAGKSLVAVCGNSVVEAGEDCDAPSKTKGCGLDCRYLGNTDTATCGNGTVEPSLGEACDPKDSATATGCTSDCRHAGSSATVNAQQVGASICGNGLIGSGEDCDLGIVKAVGNSQSALGCSEKCLHLGTALSSQWCFAKAAQSGFAAADYQPLCQKAISQCGDGMSSPDEDAGCDLGNGQYASWCNDRCLVNDANHQFVEGCRAGTEGCDNQGQHVGASLAYSIPSACGDGSVGIGEDAFCETNLGTSRNGLVNPWVLAVGVGKGVPSGNPPAQTTNITAAPTPQLKGQAFVQGSGVFSISCGYKTDAECQAIDPGFGVGADSCCYARPKLTGVYPGNLLSVQNAVCPNTYIEAQFDSPINLLSVSGTVLLARGFDGSQQGVLEAAAACSAGSDVSALVATALPRSIQQPWYAKLWSVVARTVHTLFGGDAAATVFASPTKWCLVPKAGVAEVLPGMTSTTSRVVFHLAAPLSFTSNYAMILKDGIKDVRGVSIGQTAAGRPFGWKFNTAGNICEINSVGIQPAQITFTRAGATTTLQALPRSSQGTVQSITGFYEWDYIWGPTTDPVISLDSTSSSLNLLTAKNHNGEADIWVAARITTNTYSNTRGIVATGKAHAIVFLCENPWPPKDLYINNQGPYAIFPYEDKTGNNDGFDAANAVFNNTAIPPSGAVRDGYFNFSTYYCADAGNFGTFDDLPYLRPAVQIATNIVSVSSSLKRFIFTNDRNGDAIGMQVFTNPRHLTAEAWYQSATSSGGQAFSGNLKKLTVDGYNAVGDDNNIYVDAVNYSDSTQSLYSTIYLFSVNADAKAETRQVFEQLLKNIHLNSNLTNYGYCGSSIGRPNFITRCATDLDCAAGEVCSVQTDKLKRDYQRLRDFKEMDVALQKYSFTHSSSYPDLKEGTYLVGQTLSVWPSWAVLSSAVGQGLPDDPVNQLGKAGTCTKTPTVFCAKDSDCASDTCTLHDSITGWSVADRRFSFACATSSYAYRYITSPTKGYLIKTHFENTGLTITNATNFINGFGYDDLARFNTAEFAGGTTYGICNQDREISTLNQGTCGDGQVNSIRGEQCDPPGQVRYGACDPSSNTLTVDVCSKPVQNSGGCLWVASSTPTVACSALSKCGNGRVESGEVCDEGALNGRYNHCNKTCSGMSQLGFCGDGALQSTYEVCDPTAEIASKTGWCTSGQNKGNSCSSDIDCVSVLTGSCKFLSNTQVKYAAVKQDSCNFDCQSYGPYCGDGAVQTEFGETCEKNESCQIGGVAGSRVCSSCQHADLAAAAWWQFDDIYMAAGAGSGNLPPQQGGQGACAGWWCGLEQFALHPVQSIRQFVGGDEAHAVVVPATIPDSSTNHNDAVCNDGGAATCPVYTTNGKRDGALSFDGLTTHLTVVSTSSLNPVNGISVEAWINPSTYNSAWSRILEKGGYNIGGGYDMEFNPSHQLGFVGWAAVPNNALPVYSSQVIPLNTWTHVVGVFERGAGGTQTVRVYVNGVLSGTNSITSQTVYFAANTQQLVIGRAAGQGEFYKGLIDEVKIYGRALTASEIADHYTNNWVCQVQNPGALAQSAPGTCGDGKVDAGEACDNGLSSNGLACTPTYGKSCSYCAADCKNVIDVQPQEYCGDGKIEGTEACDTDPNTGVIYAAKPDAATTVASVDSAHKGYEVYACSAERTDSATFKKGAKVCANKCSAIRLVTGENSCIVCGLNSKTGIEVTGSILNALNPTVAPFANTQSKNVDLFIGTSWSQGQQLAHAYSINGSSFTLNLGNQSAPTTNAEKALIAADSVCSFGDPPNYAMILNTSYSTGPDSAHTFAFPVSADPTNQKPWRNDLVLSPIISQNGIYNTPGNAGSGIANNSVRSDDIRVVISWVKNTDFFGGFIDPVLANPTLEGAGFTKVTDYTYYLQQTSPKNIGGIWYHGLGTTQTQTNEEAFTINTAAMDTGMYAFYVRTPSQSLPMKNYRSSALLKVDVFFPEDDHDPYHFALPAKTFYLNQSESSDNPNANYWQVFNIVKPANGQPSVTNRIVTVNKIKTDPAHFDFVTP